MFGPSVIFECTMTSERLNLFKEQRRSVITNIEKDPNSYKSRFNNLVGRLTMKYIIRDNKENKTVVNNKPSLTFQLKKNQTMTSGMKFGAGINNSNAKNSSIISSLENDFKNAN